MLKVAVVTGLLAWTPAGFQQEFSARVIRVQDGDTLIVVRTGDAAKTPIRVFLQGIDAPEAGQAHSEPSRRSLVTLALGKTVTVKPYGRDSFGRLVARLERDGLDLSREQIRLGSAWHFVRYDRSEELAKAEEEARGAKRGLWADPNPMPPWEYRKGARRAGSSGADSEPQWCRGDSPCEACRSCESCRHCSKERKSCGACRREPAARS